MINLSRKDLTVLDLIEAEIIRRRDAAIDELVTHRDDPNFTREHVLAILEKHENGGKLDS